MCVCVCARESGKGRMRSCGQHKFLKAFETTALPCRRRCNEFVCSEFPEDPSQCLLQTSSLQLPPLSVVSLVTASRLLSQQSGGHISHMMYAKLTSDSRTPWFLARSTAKGKPVQRILKRFAHFGPEGSKVFIC